MGYAVEVRGWGRAALVAMLAALASLPLVGALALGGDRQGTLSANSTRLGSVPLAEQAVISDRLGAAEPAFRARASRDGYRIAGGSVVGYFGRRELALRVGASSVSLSLTGLGHGLKLTPAPSPELSARSNRIDYLRPGVLESYQAGPFGIEQSFSLAHRAPGAGPLTLALAIRGDVTPHLLVRDRELMFGTQLHYGGLSVVDARGRHLPSWLELRSHQLLIRANDTGAVYPLRVDPLVQVAKLTASDGAAGDQFGNSIAVSGSTVVVGASSAKVGSNGGQGAVYVFTQGAGGWGDETQAAKLTASDGATGDALGTSVAISGSTVVAGAPQASGGGAVYLFYAPAGGWAGPKQEDAKLTASSGAPAGSLGYSVGITGGTVVAGAPATTEGANGNQGAVYVFDDDGAGFSGLTHQSALRTASDGAANDNLGAAVAISGKTVVASAPWATINANSSQGAVYVFTKPDGGWTGIQTESAKMHESSGQPGDFFGSALAIHGGTVAATVPSAGASEYVFQQLQNGNWPTIESAQLHPSDGEFIQSIGVSDSAIVAGAPNGGAAGQGAVYVFNTPSGGWSGFHSEDAQLTASDGAAGDALGRSAAVDGTTIAAGATGAKVNNNASGAAYLFQPSADVTTGSTHGITDTGATVAGLIDPNGKDTSYWFEYGTGTTYGSSTPTGDAGTTNGFVGEADLTGLQSATTYHYRVVAQQGSGNPVYGADRTFTTSSGGSSGGGGGTGGTFDATTGSATNITGTTATVTGLVDPNGTNAKYDFVYGKSPIGGLQTPLTDTGTGNGFVATADLTGLDPGTTYYYHLAAVQGTTEVTGAERTFRTLGPIVTTGSASSITPGGATVSGTVDPRGSDATYHFEYGTSFGYGDSAPVPAGSVSAGEVQNLSANLTGLDSDRTYHYRLVATNADGTTVGSDQTFRTPVGPPQIVSQSAVGSATASTASFKVSTSVNTLTLPGTLTLEYGPDTSYGNSTSLNLSTGSNNKTLTASKNVYPGVTYHYRLIASSTGGTTTGDDDTVTIPELAPIATTGSAQDLGGGTAVFNGTIDARGAAVSYYVQYTYSQSSCGTEFHSDSSTASGTTPAQTIAAGTYGAVSVSMSALVGSGQTVSYQLIATDDAGSSTGATGSLTLRGGSHDSQSATSLTATGAQLNVFLSGDTSPLAYFQPNNPPAIGFEYGPTTAYASQSDFVEWWSLPCPLSHSETVSGLQSGSTYHYHAVDDYSSGLAGPQFGEFKCTVLATSSNGFSHQPCPVARSLADATFTTPAGSSGGGVVVLGGGGTLGTNVACQSSQACTGTLQLTTTLNLASDGSIARAHNVVVGQGSFRLRPHSRALVRIKLTPTGRRLLRQGRLGRVTEVLQIRARHGRAVASTKVVRVTRPRRGRHR